VRKVTSIFIIFMVMQLALVTSVFSEKNMGQKKTLEQIKNSYEADQNVKNITEFNKKYVLVEWQRLGDANRFELYNLETGSKDIAYFDIYHVRLEQIINENWFIFLTDGRNHINSHVSFPFVLECKRERAGEKFIKIRKQKYFPIVKEIEFGFLKNHLVSDVVVSDHSIKILFEPLFDHYAGGGPDIPPIKTSFNGYQFIITIEGTQPKFDFFYANSQFFGSHYIKEVEFERALKDTIIAVTLEIDPDWVDAPPRFYTGHIGRESHFWKRERPYVQFTFLSIEGPENLWIK